MCFFWPCCSAKKQHISIFRSLIVAWPLRPWMTIWRICQDVMAEMLGFFWGQEASYQGKIWENVENAINILLVYIYIL